MRGASASARGLFVYPTLMAADILLYQAQRGARWRRPKTARGTDARHCRALQSPVRRGVHRARAGHSASRGADHGAGRSEPRKCPRSAEGQYHSVGLLDDPDKVRKTIMRAVTDSQQGIVFDPSRPGLFNLLTIYQAFDWSGERRD